MTNGLTNRTLGDNLQLLFSYLPLTKKIAFDKGLWNKVDIELSQKYRNYQSGLFGSRFLE